MLTNRLAIAAAALVLVVGEGFALSRLTGSSDLRGWIVFEHFGAPPDGSARRYDPGYQAIWLVHADGTGLHELAPGTSDSPTGAYQGAKVSPDISSDGSWVVYEKSDGRPTLAEARIDGTEVRPLQFDCPGAEACEARDPAYAPDGRSVVFALVDRKGATTMVIAVLNLATGTIRPLESTRSTAASGALLTQPGWSPDGAQIVYGKETHPGPDGIMTDARILVAKADDSGVRELPRPTGRWAFDPDWSPDGTRIVFSSARNQTMRDGEADIHPPGGIYTIHFDGTQLATLCEGSGCLGGGRAPSWTADGRHILFWGDRTWALMDPDGSDVAHVNQSHLTWDSDRFGYGFAAFLQPTP